jgi:CPA1 family monovalent cation:H+ antiporter
VVAVFKKLGVPARLGILVEGESLLNDGTAVVFFGLVLGMATGSGVSAGEATLEFAQVVGGGFLIGGLVGGGLARVIRRVDEAMIEITLTMLTAYGSFVAAEHFQVSGVIATVTAGMICGNYAAKSGMSPSTRLAVETFWEYLAFALNSIVFLLIGFEVDLPVMLAAWKPILAGFVALTIARAVVIAAVSAIMHRTRERLPWRWAAVLTWGGLRGGLSMVLALSLPRSFAPRGVLIAMTFGVVLLSIIVQGVSMAPFLRLLGVVRQNRDRRGYDLQRGDLLAARAALANLDQVADTFAVAPELVSLVREEYEQRLKAAGDGLSGMVREEASLRDEVLMRLRRHLVTVERNAVGDAARHGLLEKEVAHDLMVRFDAEAASLRAAAREEEE